MAASWTPRASDVEQPFNQGDANRLPNMEPDAGGLPKSGSNGYLENSSGERVFLWVNNVEANFSMVGSTAQSHRYRRFYPHNFAQPTLSINVQTPNQFQHGRLSEFIRDSQKRGLTDDVKILRLRVMGGGYEAKRNVRGVHKPIDVVGYVLKVDRGAERFINAPEMQFEIAITQSVQLLGLVDVPARRAKLETIMGALKEGNGYNFVPPPSYDIGETLGDIFSGIGDVIEDALDD